MSPDSREQGASARTALAALRRADPAAWGPATETLAALGAEGLHSVVSRVKTLRENASLLSGVSWVSTGAACLTALACSIWTFVLPARNLDRPPETLERGLLQLGLVLLMVALAAIPLLLVPLLRRRIRREIEVLSGVFTTLAGRIADPSAIGCVATAYSEPSLRSAARDRFVELAPLVDDSIGAGLAGSDVSAIGSLLRRAEGDWPLAHAAIGVLSHSTNVRAATAIQVFAAGLRGSPADVRDAAAEAAERIRTRAASGHDVRSLLRRSSTEHAESSSLLRPAEGGDESAEQLLRGGDSDPAEPE